MGKCGLLKLNMFCGVIQLRIMFLKRVDLNPTEVDTLKRVVRRNIEVEIAAYGNRPERESQNRRIFESENVVFNHITSLDLDSANRLASRIVAHVIRARPEAVMSTEVYHRHSLILSLIFPRTYSYTFQNIVKRSRSIRIMKRFCRIIVPVPSTGKVWAEHGFPKDRIYIAPFGVDTHKFKGRTVDFDEARILYVGRITEEKGLNYLLDCLSRLKMPFDAKIIGAGEIQKFSALASRLAFKGRLRFVPFVEREKLHRFYSWSNIFIMPSIAVGGWTEQLGMALLEAMAYGRLVIGTNTGAIPDVIGGSGILVRERSGLELARAVNWAMSNPDSASILAKKARRRVVEKFDARLCAEKMLRALVGKGETYLNAESEYT